MVSDTEKTASKGPNKDSRYVLNDSNGLGDAVEFGRAGYDQAQFFYRASRPGKFLLILVSRSDRSFGSPRRAAAVAATQLDRARFCSP